MADEPANDVGVSLPSTAVPLRPVGPGTPQVVDAARRDSGEALGWSRRVPTSTRATGFYGGRRCTPQSVWRNATTLPTIYWSGARTRISRTNVVTQVVDLIHAFKDRGIGSNGMHGWYVKVVERLGLDLDDVTVE